MIVMTIGTFLTLPKEYVYSCNDGRTGCDSSMRWGWPFPIIERNTNSTLPPQFQKTETSLNAMGLILSVLFLAGISTTIYVLLLRVKKPDLK